MLADAATQLSETVSCAAERKAAVGAADAAEAD
jgi:hypothetical protein